MEQSGSIQEKTNRPLWLGRSSLIVKRFSGYSATIFSDIQKEEHSGDMNRQYEGQ